MKNKLFSMLILPFGLLASLTSCKKDDVSPTPTGPSSCEQNMAATRQLWNERFAVVDSLWQSGQIVDCEGYIGAMNYYINGANNEGSAYSCGWQTIPQVTDCPPR